MGPSGRAILRGIAAIGVAAAAGMLVFLAAQTVAPRLAALPTLLVVDAVESGVDVAIDTLEVARERFDQARWFGLDPALETDAAVVDLALSAHPERDDAVRGDDIARARERLASGLSLAPMNGLAWMRLAYVEFLSGGETVTSSMLEALVMSTTLMPFDPILLYKRLHLWFVAYDSLDEAQRTLYRRQLQLAFDLSPPDLVRVAEGYGKLHTIRTQLEEMGTNPDELDLYFPVPFSRRPRADGPAEPRASRDPASILGSSGDGDGPRR